MKDNNRLSEDNFLNTILLDAEEQKASDIHLKTNEEVYFRLMGDIVKIGDKVYGTKEIIGAVEPVLSNNLKIFFRDNMQADFAFASSSGTRYRANLYRIMNGVGLALRTIDNRIRSLEEMGAPMIFKKIASLEKGLVIVSGPTGSGKSTTLASMIDYINDNYQKHIISLEDPIEFVHESKKSLIHQREVGNDVISFSDGLKGALREDPDIILLGEMRDRETVKEALSAAETGHLVFATLHTQTAAKTIDRIIDTCVPEEQAMIRAMLSTSIQAVILQKLLKRADGKGRLATYEIMLGTSGVRNLIRENKVPQIDSVIQTGSKYGMLEMKTHATDLLNKGLIKQEELDKVVMSISE